MPDADLYVNVCIFVIISYAMRYPVKSILFKKPLVFLFDKLAKHNPVKSILFKKPQSQQKNKKRNAATRHTSRRKAA